MFCREPRVFGLCCALLFTCACARRPEPAVQRIAILRFENFAPDRSFDWMGRAFTEVITSELSDVPKLYAIPSARLHTLNQTLGIRAVSAPGISAEEQLALAAGAARIGYGEYSVSGGRLRCRLTLQDPRTLRVVQGPIEVTTDASDLIGAATALARQISAQAQPYGTHSAAALEAYAKAVEASDPAVLGQLAEAAIAADPNFGSPYLILAELKTKQQDRAGAAAVLESAMGRGDAIRQADRIRLEILATTMRGDNAGLERALAALVRIAPFDPIGWRSVAETSISRRQYSQAAQAYERALTIEPEDLNMWNQLGYTAAYAGNLDLALKALGHYQALRPADPNPTDSLGDVNLLAGRLPEAERLYLEVYKKYPTFLGGADLYKAAMARLMTGDVAGADTIFKDLANSPILGAEWLWVSGRRKQAYAKLAAEAPTLSNRDLQSRAYSELAMWALFLNDRDGAARMAQQGVALATPTAAAAAAVARFVVLPPASPTEWSMRAEQFFPNPLASSVKDFATLYALLVNQQFPAALPLLRQLDARGGVSGDRSASIELAWALIETGDFQNAAPLLRLNPVPNPNGPGAFTAFYFPRLFRLRAQIAEREGKADEARENQRIYSALGGE